MYEEEKSISELETQELKLDYPKEFVRQDPSCRYMKEIHEMAVTGKSISASMGTELPMPSWDDILILGAQLDPMPLDEHAPVKTRTVIGEKREKTVDFGKSGICFPYVLWGSFQRSQNSAGEGIGSGRKRYVFRRGRYFAGRNAGG